MKKNIDELVRKIIKESLEGKAGELEDKISMEEWDQEPTISNQPSDMHEDTCGYHMKTFGEDDERTKRFCKSSEMDEELIGGQKKLDKNKNGRLDKKDFEMLRGDVEEGFDDTNDYDDNELEDYGEKDTAFSRMKRGKGDVEDVEPESTDMGLEYLDNTRLDDEEYMSDWKNRFRNWMKNVKDYDDKGHPKHHIKNGKFYHGDEMDEEVEEGNAFTGALAKTKKGDKFNLGGKSYTDRSNLKEAERFIKKAIKTVNFNKKTVKESLQLTESEMIDLIEKIVMEQKKAKGMAETEKVLSANKKENEAAISAVSKKMKEYLKDGSKGEYSTEPKIFPKGNGELAKMDKMAYNSSEAVEEYIDAFAHPGQTNLVFDEIKPDDEKIKRYLKGDAKSGNSQKYANSVETEVGDKFYKNYEDNLYGAEQMNASYKRQPQPVDMAGETKGTGSLKSIRGKNSAKKAQKVIDKVDESKVKSEKLISEEFDKMKHLMGYKKKTQ